MNGSSTKKKRGFTLVEVLVVMGIIILLSAFALSQLAIVRRNSRNVERITEGREILNFIDDVRRINNFDYPESAEVVFTSSGINVSLEYIDPVSGQLAVLNESYSLDSHLVPASYTDSSKTLYYYEKSRGGLILCIELEGGRIESLGNRECPPNIP